MNTSYSILNSISTVIDVSSGGSRTLWPGGISPKTKVIINIFRCFLSTIATGAFKGDTVFNQHFVYSRECRMVLPGTYRGI